MRLEAKCQREAKPKDNDGAVCVYEMASGLAVSWYGHSLRDELTPYHWEKFQPMARSLAKEEQNDQDQDDEDADNEGVGVKVF